MEPDSRNLREHPCYWTIYWTCALFHSVEWFRDIFMLHVSYIQYFLFLKVMQCLKRLILKYINKFLSYRCFELPKLRKVLLCHYVIFFHDLHVAVNYQHWNIKILFVFLIFPLTQFASGTYAVNSIELLWRHISAITCQIIMSICQIFMFTCQLFMSSCQVILSTYQKNIITTSS